MRLLRFLFVYIPLAGFSAALFLFLSQNWRPVQIEVFGLQYSISLALVLTGMLICGGLLTLVLLLPGRLAIAVRAWSLERDLRRWEQDLWRLRDQRERMLAQHEHLLEAHERMLLNHQALVREHSQVLTERDEARARAQADGERVLSQVRPPAREIISGPRAATASPIPVRTAVYDDVDTAVAAGDGYALSRGKRDGRERADDSTSAPQPSRGDAPSPPARQAHAWRDVSNAMYASKAPEAANAEHDDGEHEDDEHEDDEHEDDEPEDDEPASHVHEPAPAARHRLRTATAAIAATFAARRLALEDRLAHLKRSTPYPRTAMGTMGDLPSGDDRG